MIRLARMPTRIFTFVAIGVLSTGLAACGSSAKKSTPTAAAPAAAQITIDSGFDFSTTPVAAGSTVTVENDSASQHTVTADDGKSFDVTIDPGKTATFPAPAGGTYKFHCKIHSYMHGSLTVT